MAMDAVCTHMPLKELMVVVILNSTGIVGIQGTHV